MFERWMSGQRCIFSTWVTDRVNWSDWGLRLWWWIHAAMLRGCGQRDLACVRPLMDLRERHCRWNGLVR